jgi:signal transduction protein with GAF and PtsI domain
MTSMPFSGAPPALAALREIARALSGASDLDTTLDLIAHKTTEVMGVDSCSIYLIEDDGAMWLSASTGLNVAAVGRGFLRMGEGLTGWAAQHGAPVAVTDAQADPRFKWVPYTEEVNFASLLAVPLTSQERVIGAMNVQTVKPHAFTADETALLALIADLAAGVLERARLIDSQAPVARAQDPGPRQPDRQPAPVSGRDAQRRGRDGGQGDGGRGLHPAPGRRRAGRARGAGRQERHRL